MTNMIEKMQAVAPATVTFRQMPPRLSPDAIVGTLAALGLTVSTKLSAAAASGQPLRAAAHRFSLKEVDAALSKADVQITDRFRLKEAMSQNGILGN